MKRLILGLSILLAASCGPLDKKFSSKEYKEDLKAIKDTGVPGRDIVLLNYYISRADTAKIGKGTTYKQLLDSAYNYKMMREIGRFIKEDSIRTLTAVQKKKIDSLNSTVSITFVSIDLVKSEAEEWGFTLLLNIANKSGKDIKAFKGTITFKDVFGETIRKEEFKYDLILKAGGIKSYYYRMYYNKKSSADQVLAETETEKIIFKFEPSVIVFTDGTELNL